MCILLFGCTDNCVCVCAVRFYACAHVPASDVCIRRSCETRNERKTIVGRCVFHPETACLPHGKCVLRERFVLDVVLGRIRVVERIDHFHPLPLPRVPLHD